MALNLRDDIVSARALAILRVIGHGSEVSQREIADQIGSSLGSTNDAVKKMIDDGIIYAEVVVTSKGKRGRVYHLTEKGAKKRIELTTNYLARRNSAACQISIEIQLLESELTKLNSQLLRS